jgi:Trk K+ transport system NAD-binding subunit
VVCLYRGDEWLLPDNDTRLVPDDEVIITAASNLELLTECWGS